jgi:hypothetical protein
MPRTDAVMAVVHVTAPPDVDPGAIEAELARAVSHHRKLAMTAEVSRADDDRPQLHRRSHHHGFVAVLSLADDSWCDKVSRRVQKAMRKALRRRFGKHVSTHVSTELTQAEQAAYWCTLRGTPHRPY